MDNSAGACNFPDAGKVEKNEKALLSNHEKVALLLTEFGAIRRAVPVCRFLPIRR